MTDQLSLSPMLLLGVIIAYFVVLMAVSYWTTRGEVDNQSFFNARKSSPWVLVAIGMIGASLSGVTFISLPGVVGGEGANVGFSYMQMVLGYLLGYLLIATVLMPIYYRLNLTSIYGYLGNRLGNYSYKTGAAYFLLSRMLGASMRLYLVAIVLDRFILGPLGIPFLLTVLITIVLIWVYTAKGGIKTIVVTDVFQTVTMLAAVLLTIYFIGQSMDTSISSLISRIEMSEMSKMWHFGGGWSDPNNFYKQFISGALIALVMTGLDQDMMQKNLTCRSLPAAQKNVFTFSIILIFANLLFLTLGALLYMYADFIALEIPARKDYLYPTLALHHLGPIVGITFVLGLIAAAYSSADSALTALTTSVCVDFLGMEGNPSEKDLRTRKIIHILMSAGLFILIVGVYFLNNDSIINVLFKVAGYTYGPILGLFAFGILSKSKVKDQWVPYICIAAPLITVVIDLNSDKWFNGLSLGYMNLALNGLITFIGLYLIRSSDR